MKFKLNKKILASFGLSALLITPIFLTSCGDSQPIQQTTEISYSSSSRIGGGSAKSDSLNQDINYLYQRYGESLYYKDSNGLLTLDFSKFYDIDTIDIFAFGNFTKEINRLILPPNLKKIYTAAFYPLTTEGYLYAKQGVNPMFKAKDKTNPQYSGDKYYFQLDVSKIRNEYNGIGFSKNIDGIPNQIYPISSFSFTNLNSSYTEFQPNSGNILYYNSPPFPLNLLSETNYLKFYINNSDIDIIKNSLISYTDGDVLIGNEDKLMPDLYFPFGKASTTNAPYIFYNEPKTNKNIMPAIVSHPYLFKYILYTICQNQLNRKWDSTLKRFVVSSSNDIFSNNGNQLTISFINQFTENQSNPEIINISLDQSGILELLNYDFKNPSSNSTSSIKPEDVTLLNKWYNEYGMLDNWQ